MNKLTSILCSVFLLSACASNTNQQWDCSGLTTTQAQRYNKNTHRFMKHDSKLVEAYGLETVSSPKTLFLRACSTLSHEHQVPLKSIRIHSSGYYGNHGYTHCVHQSDEPSYQIYEIFIAWAKQPFTVREQTQQQTNEKILALNCPKSGAKRNEAAWYVENEQHSQTPVLVSNARENIMLNGIFANRTIAIDAETAQYLSLRIKQYFGVTK